MLSGKDLSIEQCFACLKMTMVTWYLQESSYVHYVRKKEITFELGLMLYTVNRKEMLKNESIEKKS